MPWWARIGELAAKSRCSVLWIPVTRKAPSRSLARRLKNHRPKAMSSRTRYENPRIGKLRRKPMDVVFLRIGRLVPG